VGEVNLEVDYTPENYPRAGQEYDPQYSKYLNGDNSGSECEKEKGVVFETVNDRAVSEVDG